MANSPTVNLSFALSMSDIPDKAHQLLSIFSFGEKKAVLGIFQPSLFSKWPFYIMLKLKMLFSATLASWHSS